MPSQMHIRDIVNYIFIGSIFVFFFGFVYWHFTGVNLLISIGPGVGALEKLTLILAVPYAIGITFSGGMFSTLVSLVCCPEPEKLSHGRRRWIWALLGVRPVKDERTQYPLGDLSNMKQVKGNMQRIFGVDLRGCSDLERREWFYVVHRFVDNDATKTGLSIIERRHLLTNFYARMIFFFILALCTLVIMIILRLSFRVGLSPLPQLVGMTLAGTLAYRYTCQRFVKSLQEWWKNVWRLFLVISTVKSANVIQKAP